MPSFNAMILWVHFGLFLLVTLLNLVGKYASKHSSQGNGEDHFMDSIQWFQSLNSTSTEISKTPFLPCTGPANRWPSSSFQHGVQGKPYWSKCFVCLLGHLCAWVYWKGAPKNLSASGNDGHRRWRSPFVFDMLLFFNAKDDLNPTWESIKTKKM